MSTLPRIALSVAAFCAALATSPLHAQSVMKPGGWQMDSSVTAVSPDGASKDLGRHSMRVRLSAEQIYLGRALGVQPQLEVDYRALPVEPADTFVLTTDGVHEHVSASFITQAIEAHATDLDQAARAIVDEALRCGSDDNLTIQIVRIDALPQQDASELQRQRATLQLPRGTPRHHPASPHRPARRWAPCRPRARCGR